MMLWYQCKDKDNSENISKLNFLKFQAFHIIAVVARTQTQKYQETLDLQRYQKIKYSVVKTKHWGREMNISPGGGSLAPTCIHLK